MSLQLRQPRRRLAKRLLAAQAIVIVAGSVTLAVVALFVSPALFRLHVQRAFGPVSDAAGRHLDQAFQSSLLLALAVAVLAAVAVALWVSWILSSRIAQPIEALSMAAGRIADGQLATRAPRPAADDELIDLTARFNEMASALEHTETTRSRLLSDLAHELRTPLSTIRGYIEGLADGVIEPDASTLATLQTAVDRLQRLVEDVAVVSRAEEGQLEIEQALVPLGPVVDGAVQAAAEAFRQAGVNLRSDVAAQLPIVEVDTGRIHQILTNVLDNACRHTPSGGLVVVAANAAHDGAEVTVTDSGDGIDPADLARVFERFYRGDPARQHGGSGIGLPIARAIARAHGGRLTVTSSGPGTGAMVTLWLPPGEAPPPKR